ncbi:MAG: hypothetical protein A2087_09430 [Spirochaetes bacterium GWD1_61_31]|nr:MAG: hypothetical protein A2Y37_09515 [Spirochaetes bacterium GWB1_60_80]OHD28510.1 MAG: hypothetical protein A2004_02575 [Spirochaetes bacterium GWC1_61_12]OHD41445.1 MAG: hypothetical protein A2Y35_05820 [Spirochaetes bacterium GWE1_60_18]OHD43688.1 MAG: hypothetical protein A2087_09430 [Spirochaetes bacterium GWD1_61_31]OHD61347.1 MAG: hypothetical protein A2Y32_04210 [Spirochaetes bacterium GWF1_60_12]HAP43345.1 hypothetical protein [Spirochaetaceae bacterium]
MKTSDLAGHFGLETIQAEFTDAEISAGYTSDLLSDVMGKAGDSDVLITIQAHKNTVAVAGLVGIGSVIICNARPIPDDMIASAREEGIALFRTPLSQFEVSGQLYAVLHGLSAIPRSDAPVANRA